MLLDMRSPAFIVPVASSARRMIVTHPDILVLAIEPTASWRSVVGPSVAVSLLLFLHRPVEVASRRPPVLRESSRRLRRRGRRSIHLVMLAPLPHRAWRTTKRFWMLIACALAFLPGSTRATIDRAKPRGGLAAQI